VIGIIPRNITDVVRVTPGSELFHLDKLTRVQPLNKGDNSSSAVLTFSKDSNYPDARLVTEESYGKIMESLQTVILG